MHQVFTYRIQAKITEDINLSIHIFPPDQALKSWSVWLDWNIIL